MAEDKVVSQREKAFEMANSHIKEAFVILKNETLNLHKEMEAFDALAKKLEHVHFSKTLKLNVGGQLFTTSLEIQYLFNSVLHFRYLKVTFTISATLTGTYLLVVVLIQVRCYTLCFQEDSTQTLLKTDVTSLIAMGTHFRYILNYLRTGKLVVPQVETVREELLNEAEFYNIEGIIDELKPHFLQNSSILSTEQRQTLTMWLTGTLKRASHNSSLIYRASRDGWAATNFHSCCDNKGPTVTEIRSGNGYIFGGYTEQHWESALGTYKKAPNSFMFSLVNPSGLGPTKIPLMPRKEGSAIFCSISCGPISGNHNSSGYYDLLIGNSPNQ